MSAAPAATPVPTSPARPRLRVVPDEPLDFDSAVRTLSPRLVRYATRRLGDAHEAEELVQEALLRAYKHRAELLTEDDLAAWSTCVTGRLVIDRLRVRGRSTSVADVPEGARVGRDTADVVVARDEARTALDALDAMPPRQAAVLWAREVEGLAYDEIGARFGMTEPAVRSILTRARKALRKEYASRGGTLPAGGVLAVLAPWTDGMGWLERLRAAMGKLGTSAALSVAGTGLLAGGFLFPALDVVDRAPDSIPATVVGLQDSPSVLTAAQGLDTAVAPTADTTHTRASRAGGGPARTGIEVAQEHLADVTDKVCTSTDGTVVRLPNAAGGRDVTLPVTVTLGGEAGVGNSRCSAGEDAGRLEVQTPVEDPTGQGANGVEVWLPTPCPVTTDQVAPAMDRQPVSCTNPAQKDES